MIDTIHYFQTDYWWKALQSNNHPIKHWVSSIATRFGSLPPATDHSHSINHDSNPLDQWDQAFFHPNHPLIQFACRLWCTIYLCKPIHQALNPHHHPHDYEQRKAAHPSRKLGPTSIHHILYPLKLIAIKSRQNCVVYLGLLLIISRQNTGAVHSISLSSSRVRRSANRYRSCGCFPLARIHITRQVVRGSGSYITRMNYARYRYGCGEVVVALYTEGVSLAAVINRRPS